MNRHSTYSFILTLIELQKTPKSSQFMSCANNCVNQIFHELLLEDSLVSYGCYNTLPPTWWLKSTPRHLSFSSTQISLSLSRLRTLMIMLKAPLDNPG